MDISPKSFILTVQLDLLVWCLSVLYINFYPKLFLEAGSDLFLTPSHMSQMEVTLSVTYFEHYFLGKGTFSRSDPSQYLFLYSSSLMSELVRKGANIFNIDIIFPKYVIAQWQVLDAIKIHFKDHFKNCHSELLRSWIVNSQPPMAYWNISRINIMYNLKSAYLKQFR